MMAFPILLSIKISKAVIKKNKIVKKKTNFKTFKNLFIYYNN